MLTDPGFELQVAIVNALKADDGVAALVSGRVFDSVPRGPDGSPTVPFPYVSIGDVQLLPDLGEQTDAAETVITLHAWSRAPGSTEVRKIARAVTASLHDVALTLGNGSLQSLLLQSTHVLRDPDGLTSHSVLSFSALTDANAS